ncbi:MAG TPA: hypothetical protein VJH67_01695 [Candidatus Paceibacterota bacterium]
MEDNPEKGSLVETKEKKPRKRHKFRDTVLVRVDRGIKEEVKELSKKTHETMSKIVDWALKEHLESMRPLD